MTVAAPQPLVLDSFLKLSHIDESPAWEFIQGQAIQKPMPGGKHSRLQARLGGAINAAGSSHEA
ncbi:MAG: Uma2 family endonuclease, partial [Cyanobacteria bacterium P01_F01_bin.42]